MRSVRRTSSRPQSEWPDAWNGERTAGVVRTRRRAACRSSKIACRASATWWGRLRHRVDPVVESDYASLQRGHLRSVMWERGVAHSIPPSYVSELAVRLLAGTELLHGPLGVADGLRVVAEEELGHRAPAGTFLHGVGYDLCPAGRLAGSACGLSRCRRYDHANANRTDCECHSELSRGTPFLLDRCFPTTRGGSGLGACSCRPRRAAESSAAARLGQRRLASGAAVALAGALSHRGQTRKPGAPLGECPFRVREAAMGALETSAREERPAGASPAAHGFS
jgi:hypothetical protein